MAIQTFLWIASPFWLAFKAVGQVDTTDLACEAIIRQVLQKVMG